MTKQWYRIDQSDVSITPISTVRVERRAREFNSLDGFQDGKFRIPWAYYVREDRLTQYERELPETVGTIDLV